MEKINEMFKEKLRLNLKKGLALTTLISNELNNKNFEEMFNFIKKLFPNEEDHHIIYILEKVSMSTSHLDNKVCTSFLLSSRIMSLEDKQKFIEYIKEKSGSTFSLRNLLVCQYVAKYFFSSIGFIQFCEITNTDFSKEKNKEWEKFVELGFENYFLEASDELRSNLIEWILKERERLGGSDYDFEEGKQLFYFINQKIDL